MKAYVVPRKKFFKICSFSLIFILVFLIGINITFDIAAARNNRIIPIYSVNTDEKKIALTFDAAWGNSDLNEIIGVLADYNAKTTFFCTGDWVDKYPEDTRLIYESGHEVQNHSDKHPHVASITTKKLAEDTTNASKKIKNVLNLAPSLYRAPYGEYNNEMMSVLQQNHKLRVIQWDVDSRDWQENVTVDKIVSNVLKGVKPGSILLFHIDAKPKCTAEALSKILKKLSADGYEFITVSELIYPINESTIDKNGVLHHKCVPGCNGTQCLCQNCPKTECENRSGN